MPTHEYKYLSTIKCAVCFYVWFGASAAASLLSSQEFLAPWHTLRIRIKWPRMRYQNKNDTKIGIGGN